MPLLDLKVQVQQNQIFYEFYKKEVSNPLLMLNQSAMSSKVKRASLTQEALRRLRNTKREIPWERKAEILSEYSHKLMVSGYNERFRSDVIKSAVEGYNNQCRRADTGTVPLHRPREFDEENRRRKKLMSKSSWFRPADTVLFIPATPNSELANRIRKVIEEEAARLAAEEAARLAEIQAAKEKAAENMSSEATPLVKLFFFISYVESHLTTI